MGQGVLSGRDTGELGLEGWFGLRSVMKEGKGLLGRESNMSSGTEDLNNMTRGAFSASLVRPETKLALRPSASRSHVLVGREFIPPFWKKAIQSFYLENLFTPIIFYAYYIPRRITKHER